MMNKYADTVGQAAIENKFPPEISKEPISLLDNFSWRDVPGVGSMLTPGGNQHIPRYCGCCYGSPLFSPPFSSPFYTVT